LAGTLDANIVMVAKKTRRLAQIFEFRVRMELAVESSTEVVGIWPEDFVDFSYGVGLNLRALVGPGVDSDCTALFSALAIVSGPYYH
jgi:hypothetical protein